MNGSGTDRKRDRIREGWRDKEDEWNGGRDEKKGMGGWRDE